MDNSLGTITNSLSTLIRAIILTRWAALLRKIRCRMVLIWQMKVPKVIDS